MPASDDTVRTIRFEVVAHRGDAGQPRVSILVDGERIFEQFESGYVGLDPDSLFVPEVPLLPVDPPARVAPYSCSCGEAGCGCIAVLISAQGDDRVVWSDPRDILGGGLLPRVGVRRASVRERGAVEVAPPVGWPHHDRRPRCVSAT